MSGMSPSAPDGRRDLLGLDRAELAAELATIGAPPFRARQLWHWIYHRGAVDFAAMTSLAKGFRADIRRRILCFGLFWHALDIIWVALFSMVYLMGVAA